MERKFDENKTQEIRHVYWQICQAFEEDNLYRNTREGYSPFGFTKKILGLPDVTLRRYLFIYDTEKHEGYKKKESERTRNFKRMKRLESGNSSVAGQKPEKNNFAARIENFKRNDKLKEFCLENIENKFYAKRGQAGNLVNLLGSECSLTKVVRYFKKNPGTGLEEVHSDLGIKGLNDTHFLYKHGYLKKD